VPLISERIGIGDKTMTRDEFFMRKSVYPVFITTQELLVNTYVWRSCYNPYLEEKVYRIPKGTEITSRALSAFGYGYSMQLVKPGKIFKGKRKKLPLVLLRLQGHGVPRL
jgi:hypothetical protein